MTIEKPPPPDLQKLVMDHGTWDKISRVAWEKYDRELKQWQEKIRFGER